MLVGTTARSANGVGPGVAMVPQSGLGRGGGARGAGGAPQGGGGGGGAPRGGGVGPRA